VTTAERSPLHQFARNPQPARSPRPTRRWLPAGKSYVRSSSIADREKFPVANLVTQRDTHKSLFRHGNRQLVDTFHVRQLGSSKSVIKLNQINDANDPHRPASRTKCSTPQIIAGTGCVRAKETGLRNPELPENRPRVFRLDAGRFLLVTGTGAPHDQTNSSANGGPMRKYYLLVSDFDRP